MSMSDRMVVGAALDRLYAEESGDWNEDATIVGNFCKQLTRKHSIVVKVEARKGIDDSASGYAAGVGNVDLSDAENVTVEQKNADDFERIGHYRLCVLGPDNTVVIMHYRQSGSFTGILEHMNIPYGAPFYAYDLIEFDEAWKPRLMRRVYKYRAGWLTHLLYKCMASPKYVYACLKIWLRKGSLPTISFSVFVAQKTKWSSEQIYPK